MNYLAKKKLDIKNKTNSELEEIARNSNPVDARMARTELRDRENENKVFTRDQAKWLLLFTGVIALCAVLEIVWQIGESLGEVFK